SGLMRRLPASQPVWRPGVPDGRSIIQPRAPLSTAAPAAARHRRPMIYDLDGKTFRSVANSANGEVGAETLFYYRQQGDIVTAVYEGGGIRHGQLLARVLPGGQLDMRYHHINAAGQFMLGQCLSTPE